MFQESRLASCRSRSGQQLSCSRSGRMAWAPSEPGPCLLVRLGDLDGDGFDVAAELQLEQVAVAFCCPQVQLGGVAGRSSRQMVALVDHGGCLDDLEVVVIQAVGQVANGAARHRTAGLLRMRLIG